MAFARHPGKGLTDQAAIVLAAALQHRHLNEPAAARWGQRAAGRRV
jgi:hypothetical protein